MNIIKRNGTKQLFDNKKIQKAIYKCFHQIGKKNAEQLSETYTVAVLATIKIKEFSENLQFITVEAIQDIVEEVLLYNNELAAYEQYTRYRKEREIVRNFKDKVPDDVKKAFVESKPYFPNILSEIQFYDKMARFNIDKKRRETWLEMIDERVMPTIRHFSSNKLEEKIYSEIRESLVNTKATTSFRLFAMAGLAALRDNTCTYNCSYLVPNCLEFFSEDLYIAMCGTGDGSSVEKYYISQLPFVSRQNKDLVDFRGEPCHYKIIKYTFEDTTESWCEGYLLGLRAWFTGNDIEYDFSKIRPAGAVLKTKGGRASGPEPLKRALELIKEIILNAQGRQLHSDEVADIICIGGDCAIAGGMRRTAKIIIADFGDERMRAFKQGDNLKKYPWRCNANISEAFVRDYSFEEIKEFVMNMHNSGRGENGIFSRVNAVLNAPERRKLYWEEELGMKITKENAAYISLLLLLGTNPCGEIILRTFCNLSIAVAREGDTFESLAAKVRMAAIIGTIQSAATHFPFLRPYWKEISEKERLLGVDIIGQADIGFIPIEWQAKLKQIVIDTNIEFAALLGINPSNATTCVKPGGNSGAFLQASSGISKHKHKYWIRNIEVNIFTPIYKVLRHSKVPGFAKPGYEHNTWIFSIPQKAPDGALIIENDTLKDQLDYWKQIKLNYTEHNPSCTIYYKPEELDYLIQWIYDNQDIIGGLTFFPNVDMSNIKFDYLPFQKISEEEYNERIKEMPSIDWELLWIFEQEDYTTASKEFACAGDSCAL